MNIRFLLIGLTAAMLAGCNASSVPFIGGSDNLLETCPEPEGGVGDYIIGAGDSLQIFVWRHDELTSRVPVRPDGKISIPLVEDMVAVGKTPTVLARDLEVELAEYLRTPKVNIIVQNQGEANQIQVVGNVVRPQSLPYREGLKLLDVIVAVGGLDDFAAGNRSKIVRELGGVPSECRARIDDLMDDGDMTENVNIYPGDVIIVPQARF